MEKNIHFADTPICQSCGMPFYQEKDHGTEADGSLSADYCSWCYANGAFLEDETLEELIDAAAQGLSKRNAYIRRNRAANAMPNGQIYAAFVEEYPDVRPEDIPQQVWEWAQQEGSLVSAYRKWEIAELRDELAALEMNQKNRRAAVGPAQSDGEPVGVDPVTLALLGK